MNTIFLFELLELSSNIIMLQCQNMMVIQRETMFGLLLIFFIVLVFVVALGDLQSLL